MRHLVAHVERQRPGNGVGGMDPTIQIEDVVWDVLGVDTVDGIAHVLASGDDDRERQQDHRADAPVKAKHGRVDVDVAHLDQRLETQEDVQHGGGGGDKLAKAVAKGPVQSCTTSS